MHVDERDLETSSLSSQAAPLDEERLARSLRRKMDTHLLPFLSLLYLCSFLDRVNIGNAKVANMDKDLGLTQAEYSWSLSIFFFGYILFEAPSNVILRAWSPSRWISFIMVIWGAISTSMAAVQNASGLLAARFFLGFAEAGLFPGVLYYLSMWYTRSEQAVRIGIFFAAANIAGAFGGILAYGIARMDGIGGLEGWRWIFLLEGIPTILLALVCFFYLPDSPSHASFLTQEERAFSRIRMEREFGKGASHGTGDKRIRWTLVFQALKDPKVPLHAVLAFFGSVPMFSLSLFLPTIVRGLGFTSLSAQAMSSPPYVVGCLCLLAWSWVSDRNRERGFHVAIPLSLACIGYICLCFVRGTAAQYVLTILTATFVFSHVPVVLSWPSNNLAGPAKRAASLGLIQSLGNLGGVLGGQIYRDKDGPYFVRGHIICAALCGAGAISALTIRYYLHWVNRKRDHISPLPPGQQDLLLTDEAINDSDPRFRYIL
ncbi:MAG: major facilitator superfamily domain-containing protein [Piptocephalis tieghemiana]|nr:MAG: major facilitator superfamily domain-containing protein [Piptocephalis tieghemiana]